MSASMDKLAQVKLTELVVSPKDDIVDGPFGSRLKASEYVDAGIPIVRLQNIDRNQFLDKNIKFVTKAKAKEIARHHFVSGDILISKLGDPLGEACIAPEQFPYGILVADVVRVRPDKRKVDTSFLAYALNSAPVVQQFKAETKGTTRPRVNLKKIRDLRVPIVESIAQQRQIVAEIEKQFTRLDAGVAALRRVQANLKRYRAAVLKAACESRLVPTESELAKAEGRTYETGEQLLARILADRRKNWHGRGKYKEPADPDTTNLLPLPDGWVWTTLDGISAIKGGITKDQKRKVAKSARSVPYLRVANVQRGYLDLSVVKNIVATEAEIDELALQRGDIFFNEGGDRDKLGRGWIWSEELPECIHQNHVFRARPFGKAVNPKFVSWYANTFGQQFFFDEGKHTTNLASISMTKLKALPVPLPPHAEQSRIVAEVERRLSAIEELEAAVAANLQRAIRLRQSILQRAFAVSATV